MLIRTHNPYFGNKYNNSSKLRDISSDQGKNGGRGIQNAIVIDRGLEFRGTERMKWHISVLGVSESETNKQKYIASPESCTLKKLMWFNMQHG